MSTAAVKAHNPMFIGVLFSVALSGQAVASNFSYTEAGFQAGEYNLKDKTGEELVDGGDRLEVFASAHASDNLVFRVQARDERDTVRGEETVKAKRQDLHVTTEFPIPVGRQVDVVPFAGAARLKAEICVDEVCAETDGKGAVYGAEVRTWFSSGVFADYIDFFEVNVRYTDFNIEGAHSQVRFGLAGWFQTRHKIEIRVEDEVNRYAVSGGYTYTW